MEKKAIYSDVYSQIWVASLIMDPAIVGSFLAVVLPRSGW
jgi:hypothetical protein